MAKQRPIFQNAIALTAVNLLLRLISTGFQVYLSRRLGAAGIGFLQLVLSVSAMGLTAGIAGIRTATMYLCAEERGKGSKGSIPHILTACFRYSLICSCLVAGLVFGFAPRIAAQWIGNSETVYALRLFAVFLPVTCLSCVLAGLYTARGEILTLAGVEIGEQLLSMAVTFTALQFWAGQSMARASMGVVFGSGVGACFTLLALCFLRKKEPAGPRIPVTHRLLAAAVPLAAADDLKSCISTTEHLMVPKRLALYPGSTDPMGIFGMVLGMVFPVMMFPAAILFGLAELLIPEMARCAAAGSKPRIQYLCRRSLGTALLYGLTVAGLCYLLSDLLCTLLFHTVEPARYLRIFTLILPMLYCDAITDAMVKGLGQQRACVRYNIITNSMDVLLMFFLLPKWGMNGYFFSFFLTHGINFFLSIRRLQKITEVRVPLSTPLLSILSAVSAVWVCSLVPLPILRGCCYLLLLGSLLVLFGIVNGETKNWLRGLTLSHRN